MKTTATQREYSPYLNDTYPNQVLFGDTHLHTAYSTDAGLIANTLGFDEAYRFAKGETIVSSMGVKARLNRPLDFLVITDHAENFGLPVAIKESHKELLANAWGKKIHDTFHKGGIDSIVATYEMWVKKLHTLDDPLKDQTALSQSLWQRATDAAERHYMPGKFTTLIGFEWTLMPDGNNLHRNVIFRDGKEMVDSLIPLSSYDTQDPRKLWDWMERYENETGGKVLAIPHNGNLSNGLMFDDVTLVEKLPIDRAYANRRMRWEPIVEVTQIKGDGEAHPLLSPDDEFADFETWDKGAMGVAPKTPDMLPREYAREAYKRGLAFNAQLGANPFKFGMIGATDSHTGLSTTEENNFFGKVTLAEPSANPFRFHEPMSGRKGPDAVRQTHKEASASGYTAVWVRENTREQIWDAFSRKEVFATTGSRMSVRLFGGFDFIADDLHRPDFVKYGYQHGVPMGGDLTRDAKGARAPGFLVRAVRDPDGANLDRVQVIKGWLDAEGKTHERIFDVAVSDDRKIDADGRCRVSVGNTVDVAQSTYTNAIGEVVLETFWQDPAFDPDQQAFYYVRAIEIPTPRWTTRDAKVFDVALPEGVPTSIQERAYSTPIWYTP